MPTILVVDNEADLTEALAKALTGSERTVVCARDLDEAWHHVDSLAELDVAVVDQELPNGSGLGLLHHIRSQFPDAECLAVTAHPSVAAAREAVNLGLFDYLTKPLPDVGALKLKIENALEKVTLRREHRSLFARLKESEERYALAIRGANDGLWDWNLQTDELYFTPRWKALLGYEDHEIQNTPDSWFELIHEDDLDQVAAELTAHLEGGRQQLSVEYRMRHRDGSYRWMHTRGLAVRDEDGHAIRIVGSQTDITARKAVEEQLHHRMFSDPVTALPNRALLLDRLRRALDKPSGQQPENFSVVLIDLDNFTKVNDALAPSAGDSLLWEVGRRLADSLGPRDTLARIGGDQFAAMFEGPSAHQAALRFADSIPERLAEPFHYDGQALFVTASVGISHGDSGYSKPDDVLRDAVIAMNRAKAAGGNTSAVFEQRMHKRAKELLELDSALRQAVTRGEIVAHYQPIYNLADETICGFETLCRWNHSERGLIFPGSFLSLAESNGMIVDIGAWCLREACRQLDDWIARGVVESSTYMSINVSARQLLREDFVETVDKALRAVTFAPAQLVLELTESIFIAHTEEAQNNIEQLKALGISLAMDDFGTGYSSLTYLFRFPLDILKIDREFVSKVSGDGRYAALVEGVVRLGQSLGLSVTAEGIEEREQLELLQRYGCNQGQGWYFGKGRLASQLESNILQVTATPQRAKSG